MLVTLCHYEFSFIIRSTLILCNEFHARLMWKRGEHTEVIAFIVRSRRKISNIFLYRSNIERGLYRLAIEKLSSLGYDPLHNEGPGRIRVRG
jgi:hypothetical protein